MHHVKAFKQQGGHLQQHAALWRQLLTAVTALAAKHLHILASRGFEGPKSSSTCSHALGGSGLYSLHTALSCRCRVAAKPCTCRTPLGCDAT